ncbi:hypothetical protein [Alienimonas californiensis]|nr:hypothetical protein [Alienimonas californiensis]
MNAPSPVDATLTALRSSPADPEDGRCVRVPAELGTFFGRPLKLRLDTRPPEPGRGCLSTLALWVVGRLPTPEPPPPSAADLDLARFVLTRLSDLLPQAERALFERLAGEDADGHAPPAEWVEPEIWICRSLQTVTGRPQLWSLLTGESGEYELSYDINFDGAELRDVGATG